MSSIESKIKSRSANYKRGKNRDVNFRDIMRHRYKSIIKNKRESLLEKVRNVAYEMRENEVTSFIDKTCIKIDVDEDDGFHSLDEEDKIFDEIKQEILDEEMKWICEQDIDYNVYLQHLHNSSIECPVCRTGNLLKSTINTISCDICHTSIQTFLEIDALKNNMENTVAEHSSVCQSPIECIVFPTPYDNSMFMLCNICQFLFQIS
ncbi:uncharacterized protein LOC132950278 [Metopolophium dirhodum]|uniref:uncharacterized protein LOC132950278 n=1 Tax=Metopolophium dirhodum TaxID=44670 RepID=UPI00298F7D0E|nr:uncharacterized protein LOC132950278 [Metopolophium dirhodum]